MGGIEYAKQNKINITVVTLRKIKSTLNIHNTYIKINKVILLLVHIGK